MSLSTRTKLKKPVVVTQPLTEAQELELLSDTRNKQSLLKTGGYTIGGFIFFDYLQRFLGGSVGATSRYLFFPLTIALTLINNIYLWRQVQAEKRVQDRYSLGTVANFGIGVVSSLLVTIALIGGAIAQSALFVLATPVMLLLSVGINAVWEAAKGIANIAKAIGLESINRSDVQEQDRKELYKNGAYNLASATMTSLITVSIGLIMLTTGLAIWAAVGFAAAMVGSVATMVARMDRTIVSTTARLTPANDASAPAAYKDSTSDMTTRLNNAPSKKVVYGRSYFYGETADQAPPTLKEHTFKTLLKPISSGVTETTLKDHSVETTPADTSTVKLSYRPRGM